MNSHTADFVILSDSFILIEKYGPIKQEVVCLIPEKNEMFP